MCQLIKKIIIAALLSLPLVALSQKRTTTSVYTTATQTLTNKDLTSGTNTYPTFNQNTSGSAATLSSARTLWSQSFDGSANVTGSLTSVGDITGGASNMTIQSGTGASRTLTFKTTTSGSAATTALSLAADQSATFANTVNATTFIGALTGNSSTATTLQTSRNLWGQSFDGSGAVTGSLTSVGDITGGASNMIIQSGTGASRTLTFKTTTSGSTATAALTLGADQSATFNSGFAYGSGGLSLIGGHTADNTILIRGNDAASSNTATNANIGFVVGNNPGTTAAQFLNNGNLDMLTHTMKNAVIDGTNTLNAVTVTLGSDANYDIYYRHTDGTLKRLAAGTDGNVLTTHSTSSAPSWTAAGSGTVTATGGSLTSNSVVLGAGTTDTKVVAGITTDGTSQLTLGVNTTTAGKVKLFGGTSGDVTLQTNAAAGTAVTATFPATTTKIPISSQELTFSGPSAARTITLDDASQTMARRDAAQTFTGQQTQLTIHPAGSTGANTAPEYFTTSGANLLTSAVAGAMEVDANGVLYYTHSSGERGITNNEQYIYLTSDNTLTSQTGVQPAFDGGGGPTNGRLTIPANKRYKFECLLMLTNMSTTSGSFSFAFGGTATIDGISYMALGQKSTLTSLNTTNDVIVTSAASTIVSPANTTVQGRVFITGYITVGTAHGGTLIPQVAFSTVAGAVTPHVQAGSWFRIWALGTDTNVFQGNWD